MTRDDPRDELYDLSRALRAHLEAAAGSGALGLERANAELALSRQSGPTPDVSARTDVSAHGPSPSGSAADMPRAAGSASSVGIPARHDDAVGTESTTGASRRAEIGADRPEVTGEDAKRRLTLLAEQIAGCTRCGLHEARTQTVFARGTGSSGLCFIGEGPGADEDAQGFPFVGKAGQLLDRMIVAMGFDRDEVYVCNIVKCRPPKNRKPEPDEMTTCRPYLAEQLELVNPSVIVALGATAVEGLLGISGGITRLRGTWRLYGGRIAVMPTFHPAYLLRTPEAKREVWQDLQEVLRHMGRSVPKKS